MKREILEEELNSPEQLHVRELVRALPDETLSLTWRSGLNARLQSEMVRRRKLNLFGWVWKPAVGLALAGALAVAFIIPPKGSAPARGGELEKALVTHYVESTASWEVAGDGVSMGEVKDAVNQHTISVDPEQEDVGAL
ncbi:MAG TPA: hypothetical protein VHE55_14975 [Fimbriimonadaceae bacterium]|nr:hypothetical protein [Fimbriimonadaceae bacterium]